MKFIQNSISPVTFKQIREQKALSTKLQFIQDSISPVTFKQIREQKALSTKVLLKKMSTISDVGNEDYDMSDVGNEDYDMIPANSTEVEDGDFF